MEVWIQISNFLEQVLISWGINRGRILKLPRDLFRFVLVRRKNKITYNLFRYPYRGYPLCVLWRSLLQRWSLYRFCIHCLTMFYFVYWKHSYIKVYLIVVTKQVINFLDKLTFDSIDVHPGSNFLPLFGRDLFLKLFCGRLNW